MFREVKQMKRKAEDPLASGLDKRHVTEDIAFLNNFFPQQRAPEAQFDINSLPEEVLLYIFSFLGNLHQLSILSCVCKAWLKLARDPSLYTEVQFTFPITAKHRLTQVVEREEKQRLGNGQKMGVRACQMLGTMRTKNRARM